MPDTERGLSNPEIELAIRATNIAISSIDTSVPRNHPPIKDEQVAEWEGMMRAYHSVLDADEETINLLNSHLPEDAQIGVRLRENQQMDLGLIIRIPLRDDSDEIIPQKIKKSDGTEVSFDPSRILDSVTLTFNSMGRTPYATADELVLRVVNLLVARQGIPTAQVIQNAVELVLQSAGEFEAAKVYIQHQTITP